MVKYGKNIVQSSTTILYYGAIEKHWGTVICCGTERLEPLRLDLLWRYRDRVNSRALPLYAILYTLQHYTTLYCTSIPNRTILYYTILNCTLQNLSTTLS